MQAVFLSLEFESYVLWFMALLLITYKVEFKFWVPMPSYLCNSAFWRWLHLVCLSLNMLSLAGSCKLNNLTLWLSSQWILHQAGSLDWYSILHTLQLDFQETVCCLLINERNFLVKVKLALNASYELCAWQLWSNIKWFGLFSEINEIVV